MKSVSLPFLVVLVSVVNPQVYAQTPQYQGSEYEPGPRGQKQVWIYQQALSKANKELDDKAIEYRRKLDELRDEREEWLGRYKIYQNVTSLRSKDEMMEILDEQRKELGVSEEKGYQRLGEYNPYDDRSYIRYYDNDGEAKISEVRGLREDLERQRADIEAKRKRLDEQRDQLTNQFATLQQTYTALSEARQKQLRAVADGSVASRRARIAIVDSNAVQDDDYDLYVNGQLIGPVRNLVGGTTSYNVSLRPGNNTVELRLIAERGKDTGLTISINRGEFSREFQGSHNHRWSINAPF